MLFTVVQNVFVWNQTELIIVGLLHVLENIHHLYSVLNIMFVVSSKLIKFLFEVDTFASIFHYNECTISNDISCFCVLIMAWFCTAF